MEKLLSVAIPTYNMEKYLNRCLDSFVIEDKDLLNKLEVIVVNDGSKDSSSAIAHEYQQKYPNTFSVIDKDNGHYGSCINAALKVATGKYFRIVDADDWVDTDSLTILLKDFSNRNEDCIFTKFTLQNDNINKLIEQDTSALICCKTLNLNEFVMPENCMAMHNLTYRIQFLRSISYKQTIGICYTDSEYVYYPLSQAKTLYCYDLSLYQYYIGRGEQSMNPVTLVKNYSHFQLLFSSFFNSRINNGNCNHLIIYKHYLRLFVTYMFQVHILYDENYDTKRDKQLRNLMAELKTKEPVVYASLIATKTHKIPYIKVWYLGVWVGRLQHRIFAFINRVRK